MAPPVLTEEDRWRIIRELADELRVSLSTAQQALDRVLAKIAA